MLGVKFADNFEKLDLHRGLTELIKLSTKSLINILSPTKNINVKMGGKFNIMIRCGWLWTSPTKGLRSKWVPSSVENPEIYLKNV